VATDLSGEAIEKARQGRYSQLDVHRGLPAALLEKYFDRQGIEWQLRPHVRRLVTFRELNLNRPWPPFPPLDLVMMRNVLLYFDVDAKKSILARIRQGLRPDGYLLLGAAETTRNLDDGFERIPFDRSSAFRHRAARDTR
jgi:chemotaxis protein methyltransferase CheR